MLRATETCQRNAIKDRLFGDMDIGDADKFFCRELTTLWNRLPESRRPAYVWMRQHSSIEVRNEEYPLRTPVLAAWLLHAGAVQQRSTWEFLRFYVVQCDRIWSSLSLFPPSPLFGRTRHEFGMAAFAGIQGTDDFYFEWVFGGTFGRATRYHWDEGYFVPAEMVWIA